MFLIKTRLDISNFLSTSQKPWCECTRAFLLTARAELAQARDGNKKDRGSAQRCKAFDLLSTSKEEKAE
jgi:hypothetical protein